MASPGRPGSGAHPTGARLGKVAGTGPGSSSWGAGGRESHLLWRDATGGRSASLAKMSSARPRLWGPSGAWRGNTAPNLLSSSVPIPCLKFTTTSRGFASPCPLILVGALPVRRSPRSVMVALRCASCHARGPALSRSPGVFGQGNGGRFWEFTRCRFRASMAARYSLERR